MLLFTAIDFLGPPSTNTTGLTADDRAMPCVLDFTIRGLYQNTLNVPHALHRHPERESYSFGMVTDVSSSKDNSKYFLRTFLEILASRSTGTSFALCFMCGLRCRRTSSESIIPSVLSL